MATFDRALAALLATLMALPPGLAWTDDPPSPSGPRPKGGDGGIPAERYGVAARAATLDAGVDASFAFVRDRIGYEAYPGVLRGAGVTLASEAGNSFDRSLLLAELLRVKGVETRFAIGTLPPAQAQRLLERVFEPVSRSARVGAPGDAAARAGEPEFVALVRARAAHDYAGIRAATGDAFPRGGSTREEALKDFVTHAWVQAKVKGAWVDLDPSFGDSAAGKAYATPDRTVDTFPMDVQQSVTVRVVVERLAGGALASEKRLEVTAPAVELLDTLVLFGHVPLTGGLVEGIGSGVAGAAESWKPFLWIAGVPHPGEPIVYDEGGGGTARGGPPRGGLGGAFGPGGALGSRRDLVAEWLEVEASVPGRPPEVTRRILLDRAGPAWRAKAPDASTLKPMPRAGKDVTTPRELHVLCFTAGRHDLSACAAGYRGVFEPRAEGASEEDRLVEAVWPLAVQSAAIAVVSDHVLLPSLEDRPTCRFYADSPRLLLFSGGPEPGAEGRARFMVDLPRDSIRGVARAPGDEAEVAARKVWFGCLQGALEHEFCAIHAKDPGDEPIEVVSTCSLHGPDGLVALRPGVAPAPAVADPERAARVAAALSSGRMVVAPKSVLRGGPLGWWEVAADGTTRTVLDDDLKSGRGSGRIPGVIPGSGEPGGDTLPPDWMDRARERGMPTPDEPTQPGGRANPSGGPKSNPGRPGGGTGGGSGTPSRPPGNPGGARPPPRPPSGPMRPPPPSEGERKPGRPPHEYLLIIAIGAIVVVWSVHNFLPQVSRAVRQWAWERFWEMLQGAITADRDRSGNR